MLSRRTFLQMCGALGTAASVFKADALERVEAATQAVADRSPADLAKDEFYWREVQLAFKLDRTLINLNNGFTCLTFCVVFEAEWRYMDMINMLPVHY